MYLQAKSEQEDASGEHAREMEGLRDNIRQLKRELAYHNLIIDHYIPGPYQVRPPVTSVRMNAIPAAPRLASVDGDDLSEEGFHHYYVTSPLPDAISHSPVINSNTITQCIDLSPSQPPSWAIGIDRAERAVERGDRRLATTLRGLRREQHAQTGQRNLQKSKSSH